MKKIIILLLYVPLIGFGQIDPPSAFSLEKYTPSAIDQKNTPMCISFALSSLHTIIYARNNNITDINDINRNRFSPTFLHYLLNHGEYPYLDEVIHYVSYHGIPFSSDVEEGSYHPFSDTMIFQYYPNNMDDLISDIKKGSRYLLRVKDTCTKSVYLEQFDETYRLVSHDLIKKELSSGRPCLIWSFMPVDWNKNLRKSSYDGTTYLDPQNESNLEGLIANIKKGNKGTMHAMVIIGYDDNKFGGSYRILNSWGENWGDKGKLWMRYEDINDFIEGYSYKEQKKILGNIVSFDSFIHGETAPIKYIEDLLLKLDHLFFEQYKRKVLLFKDDNSRIELIQDFNKGK